MGRIIRRSVIAAFVFAVGAVACSGGVDGTGSGTASGAGSARTSGTGGSPPDSTNTTEGTGPGGSTSGPDGTGSAERGGTAEATDPGENGGTAEGTPAGGNSGTTEGTPAGGNGGTVEGTDPGGQGTDAPGGGGGAVVGNLIASPDNADCVYQPGGAVGGANAIQVYFYILLIGANPDQLPGLVHVTATSDTGLAADYRSAVSNQAQSVAALPVRAEDFGRTHSITLTVDAGNEVAESDEGDNRIRTVVTLPAGAAGTTTLNCTMSRALL
jgi:hypothetical protein